MYLRLAVCVEGVVDEGISPALAAAAAAEAAAFALTIITDGGTSHFQKKSAAIQIQVTTINDVHRTTDDALRRFKRMPSINATRAKRYPQKAVEDKMKKTPQDSIAEAETVPAPPRIKLMDVTTNSARKRTPPELPTS
mmetsp:Transcript_10472/g.15254  ORF Transcript_10472/g.15254 Transcript_10472/m.15254 type:complete len:138 (+) Transcript_10472:131-544(+)